MFVRYSNDSINTRFWTPVGIVSGIVLKARDKNTGLLSDFSVKHLVAISFKG